MASSLFTRLTDLANSPKGKEAIRQAQEKAQQFANSPKVRNAVGTATRQAHTATHRAQQFVQDPRTRARVDEIRRMFPKGRGRGEATHGR